MKKVLVLCTGNSCRSQMAHGFLEHYGKGRIVVKSAGIETHGLNPLAVKVMAEAGIDISHHCSNHVDEYSDIQFDYVITVCDNANENCPYFPGNVKRIHQNFSDPSKLNGTEPEVIGAYRKTRDEIGVFVQRWIGSERL